MYSQEWNSSNIASLNGYLKHWETHKVIQNKTLYTWINEEGVMASQRTYKGLHSRSRLHWSPLWVPKGRTLTSSSSFSGSTAKSWLCRFCEEFWSHIKNKIKSKASTRWSDLPWSHTDSWIKCSRDLLQEDIADQSEKQPDDLHFLQFISRSTDYAKRAMIIHEVWSRCSP